jgi:hypothetical protein
MQISFLSFPFRPRIRISTPSRLVGPRHRAHSADVTTVERESGLDTTPVSARLQIAAASQVFFIVRVRRSPTQPSHAHRYETRNSSTCVHPTSNDLVKFHLHLLLSRYCYCPESSRTYPSWINVDPRDIRIPVVRRLCFCLAFPVRLTGFARVPAYYQRSSKLSF